MRRELWGHCSSELPSYCILYQQIVKTCRGRAPLLKNPPCNQTKNSSRPLLYISNPFFYCSVGFTADLLKSTQWGSIQIYLPFHIFYFIHLRLIKIIPLAFVYSLRNDQMDCGVENTFFFFIVLPANQRAEKYLSFSFPFGKHYVHKHSWCFDTVIYVSLLLL